MRLRLYRFFKKCLSEAITTGGISLVKQYLKVSLIGSPILFHNPRPRPTIEPMYFFRVSVQNINDGGTFRFACLRFPSLLAPENMEQKKYAE